MNHFAYGIVDKNNHPYLGNGSVLIEREDLDRSVEFMNSSPNLFDVADRVPLRVVPLYFPPEGKWAVTGNESNQAKNFIYFPPARSQGEDSLSE
ncbi:hypothetical protein [Nitrosomonas sp. Nm34]|uniref:hypothetical protein n=1 Tax=Nitrosomonas sp. Nm34 TaxID=1881055 RepID=UPI0008EF4C5E|nr:hypothetical protein [Nitrosomonas sp. Nm34]SFI75273.1 hypothetical protein SAMN05428978_103242 [Nitrosomonas sp. Nm34]